MECDVAEIDKWTFIVLAMSHPANLVKMYLNGEVCQWKNVRNVKPDPERKWISPHLEIFNGNEGISLLDELKFYNSFPRNDDQVREMYLKEKKDYME